MKRGVKLGWQTWKLNPTDMGSFTLYVEGRTILDGVRRNFRARYGGYPWDRDRLKIKLHFFPHKGKVRLNIEFYMNDKFKDVGCYWLPYNIKPKDWDVWEHVWYNI